MSSLAIVVDDRELKEMELWRQTTMANTSENDTGGSKPWCKTSYIASTIPFRPFDKLNWIFSSLI